MRKRLLMVCLALACAASLAFGTDFAVVAHASNPVKAMTLADLGKIFRGKTATWQNGRNITLVLREPDSPGMKFVIEKVLGGGFCFERCRGRKGGGRKFRGTWSGGRLQHHQRSESGEN